MKKFDRDMAILVAGGLAVFILFGVSINMGEGPECTPIYQILLGWL